MTPTWESLIFFAKDFFGDALEDAWLEIWRQNKLVYTSEFENGYVIIKVPVQLEPGMYDIIAKRGTDDDYSEYRVPDVFVPFSQHYFRHAHMHKDLRLSDGNFADDADIKIWKFDPELNYYTNRIDVDLTQQLSDTIAVVGNPDFVIDTDSIQIVNGKLEVSKGGAVVSGLLSQWNDIVFDLPENDAYLGIRNNILDVYDIVPDLTLAEIYYDWEDYHRLNLSVPRHPLWYPSINAHVYFQGYEDLADETEMLLYDGEIMFGEIFEGDVFGPASSTAPTTEVEFWCDDVGSLLRAGPLVIEAKDQHVLLWDSDVLLTALPRSPQTHYRLSWFPDLCLTVGDGTKYASFTLDRPYAAAVPQFYIDMTSFFDSRVLLPDTEGWYDTQELHAVSADITTNWFGSNDLLLGVQATDTDPRYLARYRYLLPEAPVTLTGYLWRREAELLLADGIPRDGYGLLTQTLDFGTLHPTIDYKGSVHDIAHPPRNFVPDNNKVELLDLVGTSENLLTYNQSSAEENTTDGWLPLANSTTFSTSVEDVYSGSYSFRAECHTAGTYGAYSSVNIGYGPIISAEQQASAQVKFKAPAGKTFQLHMSRRQVDVVGVILSTHNVLVTADGTWQTISGTDFAVAEDSKLLITAYTLNGVPGDITYFDEAQVEVGSEITIWSPGGQAADTPQQVINVSTGADYSLTETYDDIYVDFFATLQAHPDKHFMLSALPLADHDVPYNPATSELLTSDHIVAAHKRLAILAAGGSVEEVNRRLLNQGLELFRTKQDPAPDYIDPTTNVHWMWHMSNIPDPNTQETSYFDMYPGDDYVTWVGLNVHHPATYDLESILEIMEFFRGEWSVSKGKPMFLSYTPTAEGTDDPTLLRELRTWERTFDEIKMLNVYRADLASYPQIAAEIDSIAADLDWIRPMT